MSVSNITFNTPGKGTLLSMRQTRQSVLAAAGRQEKGDSSDPESRRATAAMMISEMAFKPMLAEMRKLPFGNDMFNGGRTEEIFGEKLDEKIADAAAFADCGGLTTKFAEYLVPLKERQAALTPGSDRANWPAATQAASNAKQNDSDAAASGAKNTAN